MQSARAMGTRFVAWKKKGRKKKGMIKKCKVTHIFFYSPEQLRGRVRGTIRSRGIGEVARWKRGEEESIEFGYR